MPERPTPDCPGSSTTVLIDSDWNIQRRRNFAGLQDVASLASGNAGVDAQGRYVITGFNGPANVNGVLVPDFENDNFINVSSSVWRIKVGVSYEI